MKIRTFRWLLIALPAVIILLLFCPAHTVADINHAASPALISEQTQPVLDSDAAWRPVARRRTIFEFAIFALKQVAWFSTLSMVVFGGYAARLRRQLEERIYTDKSLRGLRASLWLRARSVKTRRMNRIRRRWRNFLVTLLAGELLVYLTCMLIVLMGFALFQIIFASANYSLNRIYGVITQPFLPWAGEYTLGLIVTVAGAGVIILIVRSFVKTSPRCWWIWGAVCVIAIGLGLFQNTIRPKVMRLFASNVSLIGDQSVEPELRQLARRCLGNEIANVIRFREVNLNRKSSTVNAYTHQDLDRVGIGFSDTMLKLPRQQVWFSAAHEFGHVARPEWKSLAVQFFFIAGGFFTVYILGSWLMKNYRARIGTSDFTAPEALPLAVLIFSLFMLSHDLTNSHLSRHRESQADLFAVACTVPEIVSRQDALAAIENIGASELLDADPHPLIKFLLYNHPPTDERLQAIGAMKEPVAESPIE